MPDSSAEFVSLFEQFGDLTVLSLILLTLFGLILKLRSLGQMQKAIQQQLEDLHRETSTYGQSLISARTMLMNMETRIADFTRHNLEIQSQFAFNRSFEEASRLIREGGTVESLVNDCGLTDAEASLMLRLHSSDAEKPRRQWKQVPLAEAATATATAARDDSTDTEGEVMVGEEIRLREALRSAQGRSR